jgi:guanylate kinase
VNHRGFLLIVSSPSGAGKTTLTRRLLHEHDTLDFSVSFTTRAQRPGERDGLDYHFLDAARFERMVIDGEFAEWFVVHGNRYGTARAPIEAALSAGRDMIFDVDYQGASALAAAWPSDSLRVFILPPDLATLASRLRTRATDAADVIDRRLRKAIEELGHYREYDHLIVNAQLEPAYQVLNAIYLTRRYGVRTDGPAAIDMPSLHKLVADNAATDPARHAQDLIDGRTPAGS